MNGFSEITPEEVNELITKKEVTLIDTRDRASYEEAHIKDAKHVDQLTVAQFIASADKSRPLVCYCYHGNNSRPAALFFAEQGFGEVYSLSGGFEEWKLSFPVIS